MQPVYSIQHHHTYGSHTRLYLEVENFRLLATNCLICMIKPKPDQIYSSHI